MHVPGDPERMHGRVLLNELRRLGWVGSFAYYVPRFVSVVTAGRCKIFPIAFYAQPVRSQSLLRDSADNGITVGVLSPESVPEPSFGRPEGVIPERFESGHTCIGVIKDSDLQGFMWLSTGPVHERRVRCVFEPNPPGRAAWDYDVFVAPRHRFGRTFARLWDGAWKYLDAQGYKTTLSWIELSNVDSVRAHTRLGAQKVGWAVFVVAWSTQLTISSCRPYVHWSPPGGKPVRLRVDAAVGQSD